MTRVSLRSGLALGRPNKLSGRNPRERLRDAGETSAAQTGGCGSDTQFRRDRRQEHDGAAFARRSAVVAVALFGWVVHGLLRAIRMRMRMAGIAMVVFMHGGAVPMRAHSMVFHQAMAFHSQRDGRSEHTDGVNRDENRRQP